MSLYTYCNLKFNSVYYAQHIPHKEETETDLVMLVKNVGWIYTPKIDNIIYDDGTNDIINTKSKSFLTKSLGNFLYDKDNMTVGFNSTFIFEDVSYFSEEAKKIKLMNHKLNERLRKIFLQSWRFIQNLLSIFNGCLIYFTEVGLIREYNPTEYFCWVYWPGWQSEKSMRGNRFISLVFMTANLWKYLIFMLLWNLWKNSYKAWLRWRSSSG